MRDREADGFGGVLSHVPDDVAVTADGADVEDVRITGDPVPVLAKPTVLDVLALMEDMQVGMPMPAVSAEFDFQPGGAAECSRFPVGFGTETAKAADEFVELLGERSVGVADRERDEAEALGLGVLKHVHGDAVALGASTRDAEAVMAMEGAHRVTVGVLGMADDPSGSAAGQEAGATFAGDTGVGHRQGDAKTGSGPSTVTEGGFDSGTMIADAPGERLGLGCDVYFLGVDGREPPVDQRGFDGGGRGREASEGVGC